MRSRAGSAQRRWRSTAIGGRRITGRRRIRNLDLDTRLANSRYRRGVDAATRLLQRAHRTHHARLFVVCSRVAIAALLRVPCGYPPVVIEQRRNPDPHLQRNHQQGRNATRPVPELSEGWEACHHPIVRAGRGIDWMRVQSARSAHHHRRRPAERAPLNHQPPLPAIAWHGQDCELLDRNGHWLRFGCAV